MSEGQRWKALRWIVAIAAALGLIVLLVDRRYDRRDAKDVAGREVDSPAGLSSSGASPPPRGAPALAPSAAVPSSGPDDAEAPSEGPEDEPGEAYPVDLGRLRAKLPDNLYWQLGAPTQDPQVLQMRAEEEHRWNELFGKVQSNTATEEEIHRYYDHRRQVSEDYLAFAKLVLEEYGDKLPERDRGLYELSIKMHRSRLEEIPRQTEEALGRREAQGKRRQEWEKGGPP